MPKINKRAIARTLENMGKRIKDQDVYSSNGENIDLYLFNEHPIVKGCVKELQSQGIKNSKHLRDLGFVPASMVLEF